MLRCATVWHGRPRHIGVLGYESQVRKISQTSIFSGLTTIFSSTALQTYLALPLPPTAKMHGVAKDTVSEVDHKVRYRA